MALMARLGLKKRLKNTWRRWCRYSGKCGGAADDGTLWRIWEIAIPIQADLVVHRLSILERDGLEEVLISI